MRRVVLYCTDEQFWNVFPLIQGAVEDFAVSSVHGERPPERTVQHKGSETIDIKAVMREQASAPVERRVDPAPVEHKARPIHPKMNNKLDYKGRSAPQALLQIMQESARLVWPFDAMKHEFELIGFETKNTLGRAIAKLVDEKKIVVLNGRRWRLNATPHGSSHSLKDLEVLSEPKT